MMTMFLIQVLNNNSVLKGETRVVQASRVSVEFGIEPGQQSERTNENQNLIIAFLPIFLTVPSSN